MPNPIALSRRASLMPASPIRRLAPFAAEARRAGKTVYSLNIGQPDIPTPREILDRLREYPDRYVPYGPSEGLPEFVEARRRNSSETPLIEAQFVINRYNEHETGAFRRAARAAGVDRVRYKTFNARMSGPDFTEEGRDFLPLDPRHARYADYETLQHRDGFKQADCEFPWDTVVVNGNGQVVPCCYDYNGRHPLGSFPSRGEHWWNTDARRGFRETLRRDPMKIDICAVCPLCPAPAT